MPFTKSTSAVDFEFALTSAGNAAIESSKLSVTDEDIARQFSKNLLSTIAFSFSKQSNIRINLFSYGLISIARSDPERPWPNVFPTEEFIWVLGPFATRPSRLIQDVVYEKRNIDVARTNA